MYIIGGAIIAILGFSFYYTASANPLRFPPQVASATATTTLVYLTTGVATSTLVQYDSYANNGVSGGGSTQAMDKVGILLQTTATSSSSIYRVAVEHSMDGVDWYADNILAQAGNTNISIPNYYTFTASSTTRENRVVEANVPLRFVRVTATIGGANGAIWAAIQPQKQQN